jgi:hypothetical protein
LETIVFQETHESDFGVPRRLGNTLRRAIDASRSLMLNHAAGNASRPGAPGFEAPPQFVDPGPVLAVGAEKAADERVLLLEAATVQVESRRVGTR